MIHNSEQVLAYWNRQDVESMYDKHLLNAEIELIRERIRPHAKILFLIEYGDFGANVEAVAL